MLQLWNYIVVQLVELILWVLRKFMYGKEKLKTLGCVCIVHYKMPQRTYEFLKDVLNHPDPWPLFIMTILKNIFLLEGKNLLTLQNNVASLVIYCTVHIKAIFIHIRKHIHMKRLNEGNKLWSFAWCPYHQYTITFALMSKQFSNKKKKKKN
jgi:hypothetical protein